MGDSMNLFKLFDVVFKNEHDEEYHAIYYGIDTSQARRKFYQTHPHGIIKRIICISDDEENIEN